MEQYVLVLHSISSSTNSSVVISMSGGRSVPIPRHCKTDDMFRRRLNSTESDLHAANRNNKHSANVGCLTHVNIYRMHAYHYKLYTYQLVIDQQS